MNPILFLDYDGVLHPEDVYIQRVRNRVGNWQRIPVVLDERHSLFEWEYHLKEIIELFPSLRIILSTSWSRNLGFKKAKSYLCKEIQERVVGSTFHSRMKYDIPDYSRHCSWDLDTRYRQIKNWLARYPTDKWVSIDDDVIGWEEGDKHHLVNCYNGLCSEKIQKELVDKLKIICK